MKNYKAVFSGYASFEVTVVVAGEGQEAALASAFDIAEKEALTKGVITHVDSLSNESLEHISAAPCLAPAPYEVRFYRDASEVAAVVHTLECSEFAHRLADLVFADQPIEAAFPYSRAQVWENGQLVSEVTAQRGNWEVTVLLPTGEEVLCRSWLPNAATALPVALKALGDNEGARVRIRDFSCRKEGSRVVRELT